jgi:hypothetical protein
MFMTFQKRKCRYSELHLHSPLEIFIKCDKTGKQSFFTCKKILISFKHVQLTLQRIKLNKLLEVFFNFRRNGITKARYFTIQTFLKVELNFFANTTVLY